MKLSRWALVVFVCGMLMGCGHGYEGEYTVSNPMSTGSADAANMPKIVIGSDYIETPDGKRTHCEKIFVRKSGDTKYLVLMNKNSEEELMKIVDKNTLILKTPLGETTLKRIK